MTPNALPSPSLAPLPQANRSSHLALFIPRRLPADTPSVLSSLHLFLPSSHPSITPLPPAFPLCALGVKFTLPAFVSHLPLSSSFTWAAECATNTIPPLFFLQRVEIRCNWGALVSKTMHQSWGCHLFFPPYIGLLHPPHTAASSSQLHWALFSCSLWKKGCHSCCIILPVSEGMPQFAHIQKGGEVTVNPSLRLQPSSRLFKGRQLPGDFHAPCCYVWTAGRWQRMCRTLGPLASNMVTGYFSIMRPIAHAALALESKMAAHSFQLCCSPTYSERILNFWAI